MNEFKFIPGKKYRYGDLDKFGFYAVVFCTKRVNHRDGYSTLKFVITDLKINEFNIGAREFIVWFRSSNSITIESSEYESIDTLYFTLDAENILSQQKRPKEL